MWLRVRFFCLLCSFLLHVVRCLSMLGCAAASSLAMTAPLTLLVTDVPINIRKQYLVATAMFAGVPLETPPFFPDMGNTDAFARNCSPMHRNPVLQTEEGYIFESNAICRYLARLGDKNNAGLYGSTAFEAAQVDQWLEFATTELAMSTWAMLFLAQGWREADAEKDAGHKKTLGEAFAGLNLALETRTFLVGERITVADIAIAAYVDGALRYAQSAELFEKYPHVIRHYNTVHHQPKYKEALKACKVEDWSMPAKPASA